MPRTIRPIRIIHTASLRALAASLLVFFPAAAFAARAPRPHTVPPDGLPAGLGFNVHGAASRQDWRAMAAAGAKFARLDFTWAKTEPKKGVYHFRPFDHAVSAMEACGLRPLFILDYGNPLFPPPETTRAGRNAYARWAAAAAAHFKGRHVVWEIWNEPNVGFWKGKGGLNSPRFADEYVALLKSTVHAMRSANPHCYILGGAVSCLWRGSFRWLNEALKEGMLRDGINALSVHPYGFGRPEIQISARQPGAHPGQGYSTLRKLMAKYGPPHFPVVATEVGYPISGRVTLREQAELCVRQYLVDEMCHVPLTIIYNWNARQASKFAIHGRPVYHALKTMMAQLRGFRYLRRLRAKDQLDYIIEFQNVAGDRRIVAWTVPKFAGAPQNRAVPNLISIPLGSRRGGARVLSLMGVNIPAAITRGHLRLKLTAAPQYIDLAAR